MPTYQIETVTSPAPLSARFYWPPDSKVKAWLEPNWDAWVAAPPQWFTARFVKRVISAAPPEVLPLTVLRELAEKYWEEQQELCRVKPESEAGGTTSANSMRMRSSTRRLGTQQSSMTLRYIQVSLARRTRPDQMPGWVHSGLVWVRPDGPGSGLVSRHARMNQMSGLARMRPDAGCPDVARAVSRMPRCPGNPDGARPALCPASPDASS